MMADRYEPTSEFLKAVAFGEDVPLSGNEFADQNRHAVIALMRDDDRSNRDWATLLIAQLDLDTAEIREALLQAAQDEDEDVRAEATLGLAQRDAAVALRFVKDGLTRGAVLIQVLEAAELLAHPSLIDDLSHFIDPSEDPYFDSQARRSFAACLRAGLADTAFLTWTAETTKVRLFIDEDNDTAYFQLRPAVVESCEDVFEDIVIDFDAGKDVVGVKILNARKYTLAVTPARPE